MSWLLFSQKQDNSQNALQCRNHIADDWNRINEDSSDSDLLFEVICNYCTRSATTVDYLENSNYNASRLQPKQSLLNIQINFVQR